MLSKRQLFNHKMDVALDYIANTSQCLADLYMCFQDQSTRQFIDQMIEYADHLGATTNIGDFRDVWHSDDVQQFLEFAITRRSNQRLAAAWVRDTLQMDPIRNDVVRMLWNHL
jgi:hypothetical protein